jgi:nitrogen regulatory protein PII
MMRKSLMFKLITCIAAEDKAQETVQSLDATFGIQAMVSNFARGLGRSSTMPSMQGLGQQTEKTILSVLVPAEQADEIFEHMYHVADLHRPHGGIIYVTPVKQSIISPCIDAESLAAEQDTDQARQGLAE